MFSKPGPRKNKKTFMVSAQKSEPYSSSRIPSSTITEQQKTVPPNNSSTVSPHNGISEHAGSGVSCYPFFKRCVRAARKPAVIKGKVSGPQFLSCGALPMPAWLGS